MSKFKYENDEIKKEYKSLVKKHEVLKLVMLQEFGIKYNQILIKEIINDLRCINIVVDTDNTVITISIDLHNRKIKVINPSLPYKKVYDDYPQNYISPVGYEYQNEKRIVFSTNLEKLNSTYTKTYLFTIKEKNNEYTIIIESDQREFDVNTYTEKILNYNEDIIELRDLLVAISKFINMDLYNIKLASNNGSLIKINHGILEHYVEYRRSEDEEQKIYLKNNEFLITRSIKEKDEEMKPFMKKIGVYNGKEKR